jgi:protein O-mannosyl-transferase
VERGTRIRPAQRRPLRDGGPSGAPAAAPPAGPSATARWLSLALLGLAVVAAFAGVARNGWMLLDDTPYVTLNPYVRDGVTLRGLLWSLHSAHGNNWHPLTSLSHMLDVQLFGLVPAAHHAVSLAFHLLDVLLLVIVLRRYTGDWWRSLLVGALFGLHPLRVESVAWVAERKDVLSGLFFVLTLEAWRRWAARPGAGRYALVALALALGLLSKPMLVTLPFVLVLLDVWPLGRLPAVAPPPGASACRAPRRPLAGLLAEKWPLFALVAAAAVVTFLVQRQTGAVSTVGIGERLGNAALSYWRYVGMTLWPVALSPFYPFYQVHAAGALAAAAALVLATALALWAGRARPAVAIGWLWYLGMLVPVIGVVQVGLQSHADRYTYLPGIGLFLAAVWGVGRVPRRLTTPVAAACVLGLALLGAMTARQVSWWRDTRTLFTHARQATGESAVGEHLLAQTFLADSQLAPALGHLRRAVQLGPEYVPGLRMYAAVLAQSGQPGEADRWYRRLLELDPADPEALVALGYSAQRRGALEEAERFYRRALQRPGDTAPLATRQLGLIAMTRGDATGGLALVRRAAELAPGDPRSHVVLALALERVPGNDARAVDALRAALRLAPGDREALNELAWLLATSPEPAVWRGAEADSLAARLAAPGGGDDANALDTQAAAQARAGRMDAARATARRALGLAQGAGDDSLARLVRAHLAAYERGKPWVDSSRTR